MKAITPEMEYLSTRQSAKVLQVSLGTVQKMVELDELIAWKTRGGHRRILASSLEQQLQKRKRAMRQKTTQNCVAIGIFRRSENSEEPLKSIADWHLEVEMEVAVDSLEGADEGDLDYARRHLAFGRTHSPGRASISNPLSE